MLQPGRSASDALLPDVQSFPTIIGLGSTEPGPLSWLRLAVQRPTYLFSQLRRP